MSRSPGNGLLTCLSQRLPLRLSEVALAALFTLGTLTVAPSAAAATRVVVEVDPRASAWAQPHVVRRLVQLEFSDVDVPEPHGAMTDDETRGVYVRVATHEGYVLVQLWDRGELEGQRRLVVQGAESLLPRRVALIAAELARRLSARRLVQAKRARREAMRKQKIKNEERGKWVGTVASVGGSARAVSIGPGQLWLFGSQFHGRVRFGQGPQLTLGLSALAGPVAAIDGAGAAQWYEASLEPAYAFRLTRNASLSIGTNVGASTVRYSGVSGVDSIDSQRTTWSARALVTPAYQQRLSRTTTLEIAPEFGAVLRPMPVDSVGGERERLGGLWLGLRVSVDVAQLLPESG